MSGMDDDDLTRQLRGEPFQRPETPGYHGVLLTSSPFGSVLSMCASCGALVGDTDGVREAHTRFHEALRQVAEAVATLVPDE